MKGKGLQKALDAGNGAGGWVQVTEQWLSAEEIG
jgi:hypothetical protein